jgi:hypothetical protein
MLIALEDARSARLYFEGYREETRASRLIVIRHRRSDPMHVVALARAANEERAGLARQDRADPFEEVWVVFDTEGPQNAARIQRAREAVEEAGRLGFRTAVSNPCFEYWLLLHFEQTRKHFHNGDAVCRNLEKHIKDYDKSRSVYKATRPLVETAMQYARTLLSNPSDHPCDVHPCTEIFRLMESLLSESGGRRDGD